jgi:hypothetical protein
VNGPISEEKQIIPLKIGNEWNYHTSIFTSDSIIFVEYDMLKKIIEDTIASNERWFLTSVETNGYIDSFWCANRNDGYWVKPVYDDTISFYVTPKMKYQYPCKVGDIFEDYSGLDWEIISIDTVIEIQNEKFNCVFYRTMTYYNPQSSYEEDFVAVNTGLVLLKTYNRLSNGDHYIFSNHELITYKVN